MSVNCLEPLRKGDPAAFASGSDDKTVRLWDIRASPQRAQHCICECFPTGVDTIAVNPQDNALLYAASGSQVFVFDLRAMTGVIHKEPLGVVDTGGDSGNEINALRVHHRGECVAVGDDEGNVVVLEMGTASRNPATWKVSKKLSGRGVHTGIIGAVAFRPNNSRELVSGGFDCIAASWDFSLGRPLHRCNFTQVSVGGEGAAGAPVVNPPFVHALGFACAGRVVLVALGDGSLRALRTQSMTQVAAVEAHSGLASCLHVCGAAGEEMVLTGGIDGLLRGWAVQEEEGKTGTVTISPRFSINHGEKINALCLLGSASGGGETIVVADATSSIAVYPRPLPL